MSIRSLLLWYMVLALLVPFADAKPRRSHIPKSAKYNHVTGAKHFKYKAPKKQKLRKHPGQR